MATAQFLPSLSLQSHSFLFDPPMSQKSDKIFHDDHESDHEISKWLKLEDPLPSVGSNTNSMFNNNNQSSDNSQFNLPFQVPVSYQNQFAFPAQYQSNYPTNYNGFSSDSQFGYSSNVGQQNNLFGLPPSLEFAQSMTPPQLYQLFAQFQQILKAQSDELNSSLENDKKRKANAKPFARRVRQTRPKVVEAKGAVQCKGRNRKKGTQCRNAALMEYIGPRPIYCAEHIELDPKSLYEKCKSPFQKEVDDNKGCKEVVLKEFGLCYKHYGFSINEMLHNRDITRAKHDQERISELLTQLEREASAAKKKDGDLYQRKNKLIPKFQEMKKAINKAVDILENRRPMVDELNNNSSPIYMPVNAEVLSAEELTPPSIFDLSDEDSVGSFTDELSE